MKGLKGFKDLLRGVNKKISSTKNLESKKIQIRLVDPNRLNCY